MSNLLDRRRLLMGQGGDDNYIHFADPEVERICLANWDTNHNGKISYAEALAVTRIGDKFTRKSSITSFEEIKYFGITALSGNSFLGTSLGGKVEMPYLESVRYTEFQGTRITEFSAPKLQVLTGGGSAINSGVFLNCSSLRKVTLGDVTSLGANSFRGCSSLEEITGLDNVETIGSNCFNGAGNQLSLYLPSLLSVSQEAFMYSRTTEIYAPKLQVLTGGGTTVVSGCMAGCTYLRKVTLRDVTRIGGNCFYNCSNVTVIIDNSVPPSFDKSRLPGSVYFYVPDSAVETYKTNSDWSSLASRIHGISELPND